MDVKGDLKNMKFIREIQTDNLPENLLSLEQEGFTLVWKRDSVELWYQTEITI